MIFLSQQFQINTWLDTFNVNDSSNQAECCYLAEQAIISKASETRYPKCSGIRR